jgi:hypothetical protein
MLGALESSEELEEDKQAMYLSMQTDHFSEYQADVDRKLAQALWGMWMEERSCRPAAKQFLRKFVTACNGD